MLAHEIYRPPTQDPHARRTRPRGAASLTVLARPTRTLISETATCGGFIFLETPLLTRLYIQYNDHHFHYGYMLHGAAVIAKYDSAWWNTNKALITAFARDIGNPSTSDKFFTVARCKDWFAGHSWGESCLVCIVSLNLDLFNSSRSVGNRQRRGLARRGIQRGGGECGLQQICDKNSSNWD